ncbi:MAG: hypothetical protein WA021_00120 [Minisyncoccia bacterium]
MKRVIAAFATLAIAMHPLLSQKFFIWQEGQRFAEEAIMLAGPAKPNEPQHVAQLRKSLAASLSAELQPWIQRIARQQAPP